MDLIGFYFREDCGGLWFWEEENVSFCIIFCFLYGWYKFGLDGVLWIWVFMDIIFIKWKFGAFINGKVLDLMVICDYNII